jgi:hypothetical protein
MKSRGEMQEISRWQGSTLFVLCLMVLLHSQQLSSFDTSRISMAIIHLEAFTCNGNSIVPVACSEVRRHMNPKRCEIVYYPSYHSEVASHLYSTFYIYMGIYGDMTKSLTSITREVSDLFQPSSFWNLHSLIS